VPDETGDLLERFWFVPDENGRKNENGLGAPAIPLNATFQVQPAGKTPALSVARRLTVGGPVERKLAVTGCCPTISTPELVRTAEGEKEAVPKNG
jgi:hypothetical protein